MKNLMDFAIGSPIFWLVGFGIMFGAGNGFFGWLDPGVTGNYDFLGLSLPLPAYIIFQTVFCATAATIVSGSMAERTKFSAYVMYSFIISAVVYPISGHWAWSASGWLAQMGYHDFAGSSVVHMVGGVAAFVGAKMLGARIGKYDKNGKPKAILGHSLTLAALGVFILWFGWFGFNGCSTIIATGDDTLMKMSHIFVTTNLAAACGAIGTMVFTWIKQKKPDVSMTLNGALAGLVAITAGCDAVSDLGSIIIGLGAGILVVLAVEFIDKVLKVDDPVGAVSVHGVCGAFGTLMVGVLAVDGGLAYGGGFEYLKTQAIGVFSIMAYVAVVMTIIFFIIKKTNGLRVSAAEEIAGLDISEHGLASSYADFMPMAGGAVALIESTSDIVAEKAPVELAIPVEHKKQKEAFASDTKLTKVEIITRPEKFEELKEAMNEIGVTGMTVTQVMGCGIQKGQTAKYYRGVKVDINLLPKTQVEIVVCKVPVATVVETAKKVLYTGKIGDGKIFVYDIENAVKVRTGEEGCAALQDSE
jgi:Amt family ammonium transporter